MTAAAPVVHLLRPEADHDTETICCGTVWSLPPADTTTLDPTEVTCRNAPPPPPTPQPESEPVVPTDGPDPDQPVDQPCDWCQAAAGEPCRPGCTLGITDPDHEPEPVTALPSADCPIPTQRRPTWTWPSTPRGHVTWVHPWSHEPGSWLPHARWTDPDGRPRLLARPDWTPNPDLDCNPDVIPAGVLAAAADYARTLYSDWLKETHPVDSTTDAAHQ